MTDQVQTLTVKAGHGLKRIEEEIEISAQRFASLWRLTRGARLSKRRYFIPVKRHLIELDVYEGPHRSLVIAEVEFDSVRDSKSFEPPDWFGREVTGRTKYSNAMLARRQTRRD